MPQIIITNLFNKTLTLEQNFPNVLKAVQAHSLDWMHACGGKGRCTTCKMEILSGEENLSTQSKAEVDFKSKGLLKDGFRLACQVKAEGDIEVRIPGENKFPHIEYSD